MRNVKVLAKDKAKTLLDETVDRLKRYFQREMLHILVEFDQVRENVLKKDKEVKVVARRLIDQEDDILLKNTRLISSALVEASNELRVLKLEHIDELEQYKTDGVLAKIPFSERVDAHHGEESDQVKEGFRKKALKLYGGYIALSWKEKERIMRDQQITYYRDCICELEAKNKVLETSIDLLKDLNMKYSSELTTLRDKVATLTLETKVLEKINKDTQLKFEEAQKNLQDAAAYERKRLEDELGHEKQMLKDELRVNEALTKQLHSQVSKLKEELKEVKQIIKVPRMHFKYLEKLEYEGLVKRLREVDTCTGLSHKTAAGSTRVVGAGGGEGNQVNRLENTQHLLSHTLTENLDSLTQFISSPISGQISVKHNLTLQDFRQKTSSVVHGHGILLG